MFMSRNRKWQLARDGGIRAAGAAKTRHKYTISDPTKSRMPAIGMEDLNHSCLISGVFIDRKTADAVNISTPLTFSPLIRLIQDVEEFEDQRERRADIPVHICTINQDICSPDRLFRLSRFLNPAVQLIDTRPPALHPLLPSRRGGGRPAAPP